MDRETARGQEQEGFPLMAPNLNSLDFGLAMFLLIGSLNGIFRGFVWQIIRLGGLLAAILLARGFSDPVSELIRTRLHDLGG